MASADVSLCPPLPTKFENTEKNIGLQSVSLLDSTAKVAAAASPVVEGKIASPAPGLTIHDRSLLSPMPSFPVIDLAGLASGDLSERKEVLRLIRNAASEWGFFQIVNHGIPEEVVGTMDRQSRAFFELPSDVKERAVDPKQRYFGYRGTTRNPDGLMWMEYLAQWYRPSPAVIDAVAEKVWPEGNPTFSGSVHEYCRSAERLGIQLLELLGESLGLQPDVFSRHFKDLELGSCMGALRLHYYPVFLEQSDSLLGLQPHSDMGVLTLLKQDAVGGLQFRKGDSFRDIEPIPGAFVVNIADTLEAWSNGALRSAEHRVVVNDKCGRFSMVYLMYAGREMIIECPPDLIDADHSSLYRPFTGGEHRDNYWRTVPAGKIQDRRAKSIQFARRT